MKALGLLVGRAGSIDQTFRKCSILLVFAGLTCGLSLLARAESDPKACSGVDFEVKRPLVVFRVSARSHVNFIKGSDDDAACPADKAICRKNVYLVPGDIVLSGRAHGAFT